VSGFDRYFHGAYAAARPFVLQRLLLTMLALDAWMLMIGHAGRYGTAGFNVAHFRWLDAIIPVPSPALYIGVLLLAGLLSLTVAFSGVRMLSGIALLLLYTYSWSMSMLDSYQHHYFVSLMLVCVAFFPTSHADDIHPREREEGAAPAGIAQTTGFGYPLLLVTVAILYTFTALAKCDALWLDGSTIQRISKAGEVLAGLHGMAVTMGLTEAQFWSALSFSVIPLELFVAAGYALAVVRDRGDSPRWVGLTCNAAAAMALMLHIGAEGMGLEIGWFSYYMMVLATFCLLPPTVIDALARAVTGPARFFADATTEDRGEDGVEDGGEDNAPAVSFALAAAVALVTYQAARMVDLPGATGAAIAAGVCLVGVAVYAIVKERPMAPRPTIVAMGAAAVVMWMAIAHSEVRWDYYRYRGGDLMRRGQHAEALSTYLRGERYATWMECEEPADCDKRARRGGHECRAGGCIDGDGKRVRNTRKHKIDALEDQLGRK